MKENIKVLSAVIFLFCFIPFRNSAAFSKKTIMVPMRDEIRLATDVYQPTLWAGRSPTILMRTPYGRSVNMDDVLLFVIVDLMHYNLAFQDTRGRGASEGVDSLYFSDGWGVLQDGYDTVEWIARQAWSDGKIGMIGASAMGMTQYFAVGAAPPHLTCCLVMVAASNLYEDAIFQGGEFRKSLIEGWLTYNDAAQFIPFFEAHPNYEPMYDRLNFSTRFDSVDIPILHMGGWFDIFTQSQLNAFTGITERGGPNAAPNQKLIMGPWVHEMTSEAAGELSFPGNDTIDFIDIVIAWFEHNLKEVDNEIETMPPVQYYLMGDADQPDGPGNRWIFADEWPPEYTEIPFYLRDGKLLSVYKPNNNEEPDAFDFDPDNPVPTIGGRNLPPYNEAGSYDQRSVESRPDVLVYTTDTLTNSITITGPVIVELYASSDRMDTDFTAKLCDVYPDGRSMLISDGILQARHCHSFSEENFLVPGEIDTFNIDLWSTAIVFAPGHAIRLEISSSNYNRFETNPNTGEPFHKHTRTETARQTVFHDADHASALILPVIGEIPTSVSSGQNKSPSKFLLENYPNPFNSETLIRLRMPSKDSPIHLEIVDLLGRKVKCWQIDPVKNQIAMIRWQGDNQEGMPLPSGVYFCRLDSGEKLMTRKIILMR